MWSNLKVQPDYNAIFNDRIKGLEDQLAKSNEQSRLVIDGKVRELSDRLNTVALATQTASSLKKMKESGDSVKYRF